MVVRHRPYTLPFSGPLAATTPAPAGKVRQKATWARSSYETRMSQVRVNDRDATRCYVASIGGSSYRRDSGRLASQPRGNWESASGSCYAIRSITQSSVAVHRRRRQGGEARTYINPTKRPAKEVASPWDGPDADWGSVPNWRLGPGASASLERTIVRAGRGLGICGLPARDTVDLAAAPS